MRHATFYEYYSVLPAIALVLTTSWGREYESLVQMTATCTGLGFV